MTLRKLILLTICAALSFGGSFTCKSDQDSVKFTEAPQTGAK